MILDITYSNIRVFRDKVIFSMEASGSIEKGANVMKTDVWNKHARILKVGAIYGPNAAGKTTLIYIIYVLKNWLNNIPYAFFKDVITPFKLDDSCSDKPSTISIRFITSNKIMCYSVSFLKGVCVSESLEHEKEHEKILIFKRLASNTGKHSVIYGKFPAKQALPSFEVDATRSILSLFNTISLYPISNAANYLTSIEIANSYNSNMMKELFLQIRPWLNKPGNRSRLVNFENCFDINLFDIKIPQKEDSLPIDIKYIHSVTNKQGDIKKAEFKSVLESSGTRVLTILGAKILQALDEGKPLFVDEFDSGFHTEITKIVIEMFRDTSINKKGAQLILTTHNVDLMDEHILRKDQIWFIEKNKEGVSELFSLAEFEDVGEMTDFSEWYLAKRFGAIPSPNMLMIRKLFDCD